MDIKNIFHIETQHNLISRLLLYGFLHTSASLGTKALYNNQLCHNWMHVLHYQPNTCLRKMWVEGRKMELVGVVITLVSAIAAEATLPRETILAHLWADFSSGRRKLRFPAKPSWLIYGQTSGWADLNRRPHGPEPCALAPALQPV